LYLLVFILLAFITMIVGGGRGALLALILASGGTTLMLGIAQNRLRIVLGGGSLAIGVVVIFVLIAAYVPAAHDYLRVFRLSDTRRFDLFEGGVNILTQRDEAITDYSGNPDKFHALRPVIGYGPEMVFQLQTYWDVDEYLERNTSWSHHNHMLDTVIEKGIVGISAWFIMVGGIVYFTFRELHWLYWRDVPFFAIVLVITSILSGYAILWLFPDETWRSIIALVIGLAPALAVKMKKVTHRIRSQSFNFS
jgi:hypothetical protein